MDENYIYLSFETCAGGELFDKLKVIKKVDQQTLCTVFKQIFGVINHVVKQKYSFKDLSPKYIYFKAKEPDDLRIKVYNFRIHKLFRDYLLVDTDAEFNGSVFLLQ